MTRVYVRRSGSQTEDCDVVLESGANLQTGEAKFRTTFGSVTSLESDLLLIAASVFATDRCIARGAREELVRSFEISMPVVNIGRIQPLRASIEHILRLLSNDTWRIKFRQANGQPEPEAPVKDSPGGSTLLFSGGLDSLAAAIELPHNGANIQIVSHTTRNPRTSAVQDELVSLLKTIGIELPHRKFQVSATSSPPGANLSYDEESSQRTRSFLFLTLAALCARRAGHTDIVYIAENGQMAIHLPLTQARIGAFSTHTAHPEVLANVQDFFSKVLCTRIRIKNPYVHRTKAEVTKIVTRRLPSAIAKSVSCWKTSRLAGDASHCGVCIPCLIRRIAIEANCPDTTVYERDLFSENFSELKADDDGRRNLADLGEFIVRVERYSQMEMMSEWPELYCPQIAANQAIDMYRRAAAEARKVLSRYPSIAPVLT